VQDSAEIYEELLGRVEERAAPLAAQIREEVARGRLVQGSKLPEDERHERQFRLAEANLGRIGKDDMAVLPYTGDERLALLCQTLLALAQTMTESRRALLEVAIGHDLPHTQLRFTEPDETQAVEFDLAAELSRAEQALGRVKSLLEPVRQEVGEWP
jgi:hypothetical protein